MVKTIYYTDYKKIFWILTSLLLFILLLFPYFNIKLIYILVLQIILLTCYSNIYIFKFNYSFKNQLNIIFFTFIANLLTNYKSFRQSIKLTSILFLPYKSKFILPLISNSSMLKFNLYYISLNVPTYIKQIFELNINYLLIMHNLSALAKNERLFKSFIKSLSLNFRIIFLNLNWLSSLLSSQLLQHLLHHIKCIYIGIKTKNQVSKVSFISNVMNSIYICLEILSDITYSYNITLWLKSIKVKFHDKQFTITL